MWLERQDSQLNLSTHKYYSRCADFNIHLNREGPSGPLFFCQLSNKSVMERSGRSAFVPIEK